MDVLTVRIDFPVEVQKADDGQFLAFCKPLDVYAQGDSEESALASFKETITLFVESCYERGTLEQVLKEAGFHATTMLPPPSRKRKARTISVPFPLVRGNHGHETATMAHAH